MHLECCWCVLCHALHRCLLCFVFFFFPESIITIILPESNPQKKTASRSAEMLAVLMVLKEASVNWSEARAPSEKSAARS